MFLLKFNLCIEEAVKNCKQKQNAINWLCQVKIFYEGIDLKNILDYFNHFGIKKFPFARTPGGKKTTFKKQQSWPSLILS